MEFEDWMNIREAINLTDVGLLDFDLEVHCDGENLRYELVPKGSRPRTERVSYDDVSNLSSDKRLAALEKGLYQEGRLPRLVMLREANQEIDDFLARSFVGVRNDTYRELWVYVWSQARRMRNDMDVASYMKRRLLSKNLSQIKDLDSFFFPKRLEARWTVDLKDLSDFFFPSSIKESCDITVDASIVCPRWLERPSREFLIENTQASMTLRIKNGPTLARWLHAKRVEEDKYENLELRKRWSRMDWLETGHEKYTPIRDAGCAAAVEPMREEPSVHEEGKEKPVRVNPADRERSLTSDNAKETVCLGPKYVVSSDSEEDETSKKRQRLETPTAWQKAIEVQNMRVLGWKKSVEADVLSFSFLIEKPESKVESQLARIFRGPGGPKIQREVAISFLDGVRTVYERLAKNMLEAGSENWVLTSKGWIVSLAWRQRPKKKKKDYRSKLSGGRTT